MDIKSKKAFFKIMSNPVNWGEMVLVNRDGSPRKYWEHQKEDLTSKDRNIVHLDGRDVGKTIALTTDALYFAFVREGMKALIAAPHQGQLDSVIEEIEFQIEKSSELKNSIATNDQGNLKITRKPYFRIEFTNGSILYFRPAGTYGDAFRSLHVERIWVDEGAWLTEKSWKALRQCLKTNGKLKIYSTPNGLRNTTYYRLTTNAKSFKVFRWASWVSPLWTNERKEELLEFYGGKDNAGWQHEVAGEHGKPSYGAFHAHQFGLCNQDIPEYRKIIITGEDLSTCNSEEEVADRLELILNIVPQTGVFWIGGDLGYTNDPTELVVFKEESLGHRNVLTLLVRIRLEHVAYPHISQVIALLDRYFSPVGICVDNGGNGVGVVQELLTLDRYKDLGLDGRLSGVNFGGMSLIVTSNGKEIKKRTKEHMTSLINGAMQKKELKNCYLFFN